MQPVSSSNRVNRSPLACAAALLAWLCLFAGLQGAQAQGQVPDLAGIKAAIAAEQSTEQSLATAIALQSDLNADLAKRLDTEVAVATPSLDDLRQAQFEVDMARTRILNLAHSRSAKEADIAALNAQIVQQTTSAGTTPRPTLAAVVDEQALALRQELKSASERVVRAYAELEGVLADLLSWRREQLLILQNAASFQALIQDARSNEKAKVGRIRDLVQRLGQQSMQLSNLAADLSQASAGTLDQRNAMRVEADELTLRANARVTDAAIVETRDIIAGIGPLIPEKAVPVRVLDEALDALATQEVRLGDRAAVSATISAALDDFRQILGTEVSDDPRSLHAAVARLRRLLRQQDQDMAALRTQIAETRVDLVRERAMRERDQLFSRESSRTDRSSRSRIANEIMEMPGELQALYVARLTEVRTAVEVASPRQIAFAVFLLVVMLAGTILLRQRVLSRFIEAQGTKATEVPLEVLRRNLYWLLPIGIWLIFTQTFQISQATASSGFALLFVPAASASLYDLAKAIVGRRGASTALGVLINRATAVAVVITGIVVFAYLLLDEVPLLPSTQLALNRLAYSVFVLAGLPMLLFVIFFAKPREGQQHNALRSLLASLLALLPPAALIATGVAGLSGFTNLAALMLEDLAIAIAIMAVLALLLGVLHDVAEGIAMRIRDRDPAQAYFVRQNFIRPLKNVGQFALLVIAVFAAANIFEWTSETVFISDALRVWNSTLFTVGGTSYGIGHVFIAAAAFALVFWFAAWSRRITYTVVLRKVKDIGIRQSLSVFAQYVVIVIGVLLTLTAVGFDVTTLTVFAASLGVGIGFGLQNVVNNFISGILLLVERPLRLGDIVTVGGSSGTVSQIGIRSMRMRTFDEFDLIVPNSALISDTFTNWTRSNSLMRVILTVGISYNDDPSKAIAIIEKILGEHPGVTPNPAPMVTVDEFGASSVDLRVCYYIDLRGTYSGFVTRSEVLTAIRNRFAQEGLSIPFPQRDVHMIAPVVDKGQPEVIESVPQPRRRDDDGWQGDAVEMIADDAKDSG